jgi:hypothetical protein
MQPVQRQARRRSISDALPFGRLWYLEASNAIDYARTCKHLLGRFNSVKKFRAFTASFLRRVFGSADHSGADRTLDRAEVAQQ